MGEYGPPVTLPSPLTGRWLLTKVATVLVQGQVECHETYVRIPDGETEFGLGRTWALQEQPTVTLVGTLGVAH
jgi:hypothetical protein